MARENTSDCASHQLNATVTVTGIDLSFKQPSRLDAETKVETSSVIRKNTMFHNDNPFWDWYSQCRITTFKRQIAPTTRLKQVGNDRAIETLAPAHRGLVVSNG
ncbi:MAG: hypothetical protein P1U83_18815 [Roseovarius sp.]|nr:hypothetical protein [Roseovarius sp.]